jgi:catechol 2,3-dioxygenase-like lactoylglutathione lyase family enzyme
MRFKACRLAGIQLFLAVLFAGAAVSQQTKGPAPLSGLTPDHASLSVGDIQKESAWYQRVLGFKLSRSFINPEGAPMQMLSISGYRLDLLQYKGSAKAAYPDSRYMRQGIVHLVFDVPNVSAAYKSLQDMKTDVTATKAADGTIDHLLLHDPEGNEFELFEHQKQ